MSQDRHEPYEELISASLHNELNPAERDRLNAHLDVCERCRETLAAFANQRRIIAGLHHVPPPRDLGARVRAGIERGFGRVPWWRRPQVALAGIGGGLALVAGAVLGIVMLNMGHTAPVGQASPSLAVAASPSEAPSATPLPTLPPPASGGPAPTLNASPSAAPSVEPEPRVFLALTGPVDDPILTIRNGSSGATMATADAPSGYPIATTLSPDGQWLAYMTTVGESGMVQVNATRLSEGSPSDEPGARPPIASPVAVGETVTLGTGVQGSPFLEHLSWSPESLYLAFTLADPAGTGTDAWVFEPQTGNVSRLTDTGSAYAGSWVPFDADTSLLWVSTAGDAPTSTLIAFHDDGGPIVAGDPNDSPYPSAQNVFQPLISPNGAFVIFWSGRMTPAGNDWTFSEGGSPWLAENKSDGQGGYQFTNARELFSDLTIGRDAFASAAITWGGDGDAYAVWDTGWTGLPQSGSGTYPDPARVYFGHATDARGLTQDHAIDQGDLPPDAFVVDVAVSPTGRHLVITAGQPSAGILDPPRADLLLIERNTGSVPDAVSVLGSADAGWFGPAAFEVR